MAADDDSFSSVSKCFEFDDSGSSPRVEGSKGLPGASTGYRRRRAVAKQRVSELS
jgi:hypothetical protein